MAFDNKKLNSAKMRCSAYERELLGIRDVRQRQWVSMATVVLMEWEWPLHPFPVRLLLPTIAAAVNY